jgi:hypothetical protein
MTIWVLRTEGPTERGEPPSSFKKGDHEQNVRLFGSLADGDDHFLCPVVDQLSSGARPEISCQCE